MYTLLAKYSRRFLLSFIFMFLCVSVMFPQKFTISGTVEDKNTGERLLNANIYDPDTYRGSVSNNYGFFSITLPSGDLNLRCSYVGYESMDISFSLSRDTLINFVLEPIINLDEIVISAQKARSAVRSSQMGMTELSSQTIKSLPVLFGEVDVLKALQLLLGVQSGSEGTSGIYVRGGGPDQNLILLDGVPVYNANHLFGFFSVFNPDAIQSVKLIKGGFPARFGGRLSSVLDIRMKDGNNKKFQAEGSVGIISSKLTVEGPILKDKTSFIVSARRTYLDVLARPFITLANGSSDEKIAGGYYFYDMTAKVNHRFSDKSRLFLSSYMGRDKAYLNVKDKGGDYTGKGEFGLGWGNITTALRWNYILTPKLFSNTTLTYSKYNFLTEMKSEEEEKGELTEMFEMGYDSGIRDFAGKIDFDYLPTPKHSIKFGYNHIYHIFSPGVTIFRMDEENMNEPVDTTFGNEEIQAHEYALYAEDDWEIGTRFKVNLGLHYSGFLVDDSSYSALQPRISLRYLITENLSMKAAYTHMNQYIHLLTNSTIGMPTDLWVPSTAVIKPQKSIQYALGLAYEIQDGIEISLEGYYKTMANLIEYKEGSSFFSFSDDWQDKLEFGEGEAYGGELLIRKQFGKTTGWLGYTLAWSNRKFENISFGEWFPYRYDRRHDISIVLNHKIKENIAIGVTWVYGTGNAVTLPLEKYNELGGISWGGFVEDGAKPDDEHLYYVNMIDYFEKRNSYRMPAYHRLDIGVNFVKDTKWGERTWSFGVYNAYNRKNPFFLTFDTEYNDYNEPPLTVLKQYSLFPIIPSISYSFKIL